MNTFASTSTRFLPTNPPFPLRWLALTSIALMFLACILPSVITPSAGTSLSVYDLAEWASLHPAVHADSPTLFTALLIRMSIAWAVLALAVAELPVVFRLLAVCLTAFALLPPFEFLADTGNANYRQLLLIAAITLMAGTGIMFLSRRYHLNRLLMLIIGLLCIGSSVIGTLRMVELLRGFSLPVVLGSGFFFYLVGSIGVVASSVLPTLLKRKQD